jgi:hypothetical protein
MITTPHSAGDLAACGDRQQRHQPCLVLGALEVFLLNIATSTKSKLHCFAYMLM